MEICRRGDDGRVRVARGEQLVHVRERLQALRAEPRPDLLHGIDDRRGLDVTRLGERPQMCPAHASRADQGNAHHGAEPNPPVDGCSTI